MDKVITISREFGSGGHEIGVRLAKKLGIPFYDGELLDIAAKNSRFAESYLKKMDEQKPNFFNLGSISSFSIVNNFSMVSPNDEVFLEICKVIKDVASKGPCVIVGRCADYILKETGSLNFFIHARLEDRVQRKLALEENSHLSKEEMEKFVLSTDKGRAKFHEYYSHERWGDCSLYDMCINTSDVGIDGAVDILAKFIETVGNKNIMPDKN